MRQLPTDHDTEPRTSSGRIHSLGELLHGGPVTREDLDDLAGKLWFGLEGTKDPYVRFGVLLVFSVVIATGGVLSDSTATVIGAMIVAPLMTPIMASALAVVTGNSGQLGRSLLIVLIGVIVSVGLSFLMALGSSVVVDATTNGQVAGRVSPRLSDLLVALASGAAGGFALSRRNVSDALPGVAIAISLVPPLCVVGVMLANADAGASGGASILFLTNFIAIIVAGGGMLAIMGYGRVAMAERSTGRRRATVVIAVATLALAIPLAVSGLRIGRDTALEYSIRSHANQALGGGDVQLSSVDARGSTVEVVLEGPPEDGTRIANQVANAIHEQRPELTVRVSVLQSEVVEISPSG